MSNIKQDFTDNTFSLAKGLFHLKIAKEYFEDLRLSTKGDVKDIFNQYISRCDWIMSNLKNRLTEASKIELEIQLQDSLAFDSIEDKLIHLTSEQRNFVEDLLESMLDGKEIGIINN